jgi:DNA-binding LacI/PurR family transcriptional regulator
VERQAGSGSFVKKQGAPKPLTLGLLIPNLADMEIFDGICSQISREAQNRGCDLLWARFFPDNDPQFVEKACEPYLRKPVDGVFFAPLEFNPGMEQINAGIAQTLDNANIPVVLLDRDITPFPQRSKHDLVGIDNFAAGYLLGSHMISCGCKSIVFIAHPLSAGTVDARATGILRAHLSVNHPLLRGWYEQIDPTQASQVQALLKKSNPDAIICANDKTAGELMQTLHRLKVKVPETISVAGVDDVRFSRLLHPSLTTVRQPLEMIGIVTLQAMMDRLANPQLPPRHIMLDAELVVRQSTRSRSDSPWKAG